VKERDCSYMEIRKGVIVQQQYPDKSPIKLVAWSY
jgi:hypothetical protein